MTDLSPERIDNAARALAHHAQRAWSATTEEARNVLRGRAEAVLRADTEWREQQPWSESHPYCALAVFEEHERVRDQALAAIAAIRPDQQSDWSIPDPARDEACDEIRAEFLRRIGEGATDADS